MKKQIVIMQCLCVFMSLFAGVKASAENVLVSSKRGLGYSLTQTDDLSIMSRHMSWWYNWAETPDNNVADSTQQNRVEFVPMAWDKDFDQSAMRTYLADHAEIKYILAFNEPNFTDQANLTPQEAADNWYKIEAIADEFDLKIVAPAMNYSPGEVDIPDTENDGSPFEYLDAFFAACADCRVDYLAVHAYMGNVASVEAYLSQFYERYQLPIWLTEFNLSTGDNDETLEDQMDFLAELTRWLEAQDYIDRYAWFIGRTDEGADSYPYVDILGDIGQWSKLGALYSGIPSLDYYQPLPARIEAEHALAITGFHHRATSANEQPVVQLFANQDDEQNGTMTFQISSSSDTTYNWTLNYASATDAVISLQIDDNSAQTLTLPSTYNIYVWDQINSALSIPSGNHTLSINVLSGKPGFDWMSFSQ